MSGTTSQPDGSPPTEPTSTPAGATSPLFASGVEALAGDLLAPSADPGAKTQPLPDRASDPARDQSTLKIDPAGAPPTVPIGDRPAKRPRVPPRLGPYILGEELGHGGMGMVFRARHEKLGTECAVKVLIAGEHASEELIARFRREAAAVARMGKHPNIVTVFDLGEEGGLTYYAMELVEGKSLRARFKEHEYAPREAAALVETVARALHFAHTHGIVHRDMKPDNIVVRGDGAPQVMDFGLARDAGSDQDLSVTGQVMGTLAYMAPEQARGEVDKTDARTDVYALGGVLYELLTGVPPHPGRTIAATIPLILRGEIVAPRRLRPEAPRDLETIAMKALALEPERRYPTAEAFADDLARFSRGEPVLARPLGLWVRALRKARRHPRVVAAGVVVLALLGAMGAVMVHQRGAVEREKQVTEAKRQANDLYRRATDPSYVFTHGGLDESRGLLEQAVALDPDLRDAHFRLGMLWESQGDGQRAAASYESALRCDPGFHRARYRLVTMLVMGRMWPYTKADDEDTATFQAIRDHVKRMEEEAPSEPYTRLVRQFCEVYTQWYAGQPMEKNAATIAEAKDLAKLDTVPEARIFLASLVGPAYFHPVYASPYLYAGDLASPDLALDSVESVTRLDPLDLLARFQLGILRYHLDDAAGAESDILFVRKNAPSWSEPPFYLGRMKFNERRYDLAEDYLRQALALSGEGKAWSLLAWTRLLRDDVPGSLAASAEARRLYPTMSEYALLRLVALYSGGRTDEAQKELAEVPDKGLQDLREMDRQLQSVQGRMLLSLVKGPLREFQDLLFLPPKEKAATRAAVTAALSVPQVRKLLDEQSRRREVNLEFWEMVLRTSWLEREHPKVFEALRWGAKQFKVRTDLRDLALGLEFFWRMSRDAQMKKRQKLFTVADCQWRAGLLYREGKPADAEAALEQGREMDGANSKTWYGLATMRALRGDAENCAEALDMARRFGWTNLAWVLDDPDFAKVREAECVKEVLQER